MTNVAKMAARTNVDMVSLGAAFNSLEGKTQRWFDVIKVIRHIYKSAVSYSANWGSIHHVEFQNELDLLGKTYSTDFSELGYTSQEGINMYPWNYTIPDVLDVEEQKDCYTAFTKVWEHDEDLYGVFFYEWFGKGGEGDFGYTPRGKPALEVVKEWF